MALRRLQSRTVYFDQPLDWQGGWHKIQVGKITTVHFGPDFVIKNKHLKTIAKSEHAKVLEIITFGAETTTNGSLVTDDSVVQLVKACPLLRKVQFRSAVRLTGETLIALNELCPSIETIDISGNDICKGGINDTALNKLRTLTRLAPHLKVLSLLDQPVSYEGIFHLSHHFPRVLIREGRSVSYRHPSSDDSTVTGPSLIRHWRNDLIIAYTCVRGIIRDGEEILHVPAEMLFDKHEAIRILSKKLNQGFKAWFASLRNNDNASDTNDAGGNIDTEDASVGNSDRSTSADDDASEDDKSNSEAGSCPSDVSDTNDKSDVSERSKDDKDLTKQGYNVSKPPDDVGLWKDVESSITEVPTNIEDLVDDRGLLENINLSDDESSSVGNVSMDRSEDEIDSGDDGSVGSTDDEIMPHRVTSENDSGQVNAVHKAVEQSEEVDQSAAEKTDMTSFSHDTLELHPAKRCRDEVKGSYLGSLADPKNAESPEPQNIVPPPAQKRGLSSVEDSREAHTVSPKKKLKLTPDVRMAGTTIELHLPDVSIVQGLLRSIVSLLEGDE